MLDAWNFFPPFATGILRQYVGEDIAVCIEKRREISRYNLQAVCYQALVGKPSGGTSLARKNSGSSPGFQKQQPTQLKHEHERKERHSMKTFKRILVVLGAAALLAGCATRGDRDDMGGVGEVYGTGAGTGSSTDVTPLPSTDLPTGANSSIGRGNPFGLGVGSSGLQPAH